MSMRMLPALCAGLMLAACADGAGRGTTEPSGAVSSGAVAPGSAEDDPCGFGNIGNTIYFATDSAILTVEAQQYA
jgi:hypothetical protein